LISLLPKGAPLEVLSEYDVRKLSEALTGDEWKL
jgi:hypothetical protein